MATAKEPKVELKSADGLSLAKGGRILRTIKMGQPIHAECQWPPRESWWVGCMDKGHEPFVTHQLITVETPVWEVDEEGDTVLTGTKTKQKRVSHLNIVQVPLDESVNDGNGPERFKREKGFKDLEELGYKPMCQLFDCWLDATIKTNYGDYCSKAHARMVGAREEGIALEVVDSRKRATQLRSVELD